MAWQVVNDAEGEREGGASKAVKRARVARPSSPHAPLPSVDGSRGQGELKEVLQDMRASIAALNHRLDILAPNL